MREFLKSLELDKEVIDNIMAEYGKNIQSLKDEIEDYKAKNDDYKSKKDEYENKIKELTELSDNNSKVQEELDTLKKQIADREAAEKAKKEDEILTRNIVEAFGDKQFVNEYTKNAIINDIKDNLRKEENSGKSAKDLFEEITKDKSDIFTNPNQVQDMEGMGDSEDTNNQKEVPIMW